jgi:phosphatidylserine/phosphatidylglycerophosphate/cardiolipin synthase-like enzyme
MPRLAVLVANSPAVAEDLLGLLESGAFGLDVSRHRLDFKLKAPPDHIDEIHELLSTWPRPAGNVDPAGFVAALRAALGVRELMVDRSPRCEVVWTGKGATGGVRSTVPVIIEMLTGASASVLLLSYSVWLKQSRINSVLDRLAGLSSAGVDVTWIIDVGYRDGHNLKEITSCWPSGRRRPQIFGWRDVDDEIAKLHAKVLIVDDRDALVTSANLTGHGLTSNIELGFRVRGDPAEDLSSHLRQLIAHGVFEPLTWTA